MAGARGIHIYLDNGEVSGIRHAEILNWTGQAILCPRARVPELRAAAWEEVVLHPAVYVLIGAERPGSLDAYIGETENILDRVKEHLEWDFWRELVFFTSKDKNVTKAHVKFLESRLIEMTKSARRYNLQNDRASNPPQLPKSDHAAMEEFLQTMGLLLGVLGHRLLDPVASAPVAKTSEKPSNLPRLIFKYGVRDVGARGMVTDDGFVVLKGSLAVAQESLTMGGYSGLRKDLLEQGMLIRKGNKLEFKEDVLFSSPTAAAVMISGNSVNGRVSWKTEKGRTLKEIEEEQTKGR